jgi:hypothetical protein
MSLPPAQQRMLDSMSEALRASEPRLAAMFALFTRLTKNEGTPRREELPAQQRFRLSLVRRRSRRRASGSTKRPGRREGSGRRLATPSRHVASYPGPGRLLLRQVLIASPLAVALVIVGLVLGLNSHTASPGCTGAAGAHVTAGHHAHATKCPGQPGSSVSGQLLGK